MEPCSNIKERRIITHQSSFPRWTHDSSALSFLSRSFRVVLPRGWKHDGYMTFKPCRSLGEPSEKGCTPGPPASRRQSLNFCIKPDGALSGAIVVSSWLGELTLQSGAAKAARPSFGKGPCRRLVALAACTTNHIPRLRSHSCARLHQLDNFKFSFPH